MAISDTSSRQDCLDGLWRALGAPAELEAQMDDVWWWHIRKDREQVGTGRIFTASGASGGEGYQIASSARPTVSSEGADNSFACTEDRQPAVPQSVPLTFGEVDLPSSQDSLAKSAHVEGTPPAVRQTSVSPPFGSSSAVDLPSIQDSLALARLAHVEKTQPAMPQRSVSSLFGGKDSVAVTVSGEGGDMKSMPVDEAAHPTVAYEGGDDTPSSSQEAARLATKTSVPHAKAALAAWLTNHQSLAKSAYEPVAEEQRHPGASSAKPVHIV